MSLTLQPIAPSAFPEWLEFSANEYAADLVKLGATEEDAKHQARRSMRESFPDGLPSRENAVFMLLDGSAEVGYVWVGRDLSNDPTAWWVWDIVVYPEHRGSGYGKAGMRCAEEYARSCGATTLGLSVFGFNAQARGLYEALGYETTSIKMRKTLV